MQAQGVGPHAGGHGRKARKRQVKHGKQSPRPTLASSTARRGGEFFQKHKKHRPLFWSSVATGNICQKYRRAFWVLFRLSFFGADGSPRAAPGPAAPGIPGGTPPQRRGGGSGGLLPVKHLNTAAPLPVIRLARAPCSVSSFLMRRFGGAAALLQCCPWRRTGAQIACRHRRPAASALGAPYCPPHRKRQSLRGRNPHAGHHRHKPAVRAGGQGLQHVPLPCTPAGTAKGRRARPP